MLAVISGYAGAPLPSRIQSFLALLAKQGFRLEVTGHARKTIRIFRGEANSAYVNATVIARGALVGHHFVEGTYSSDSCPGHLVNALIGEFCTRYGCGSEALDAHPGTGNNARRLYLLFREPDVALRALGGRGIEKSDDDSVVVERGDQFLEGRLIEVSMQQRERSAGARLACLSRFGFNCFACGANLKQRYAGLDVEVIHVHHEEPLGLARGEREVDPYATLKPLCPNCHCVAHARNPPFSIDELRRMLDLGRVEAVNASHRTA